MNAEKLFNAFPDLFFGSLKEQMFMGILSSETVETILRPLLEEYDKIMPQLPIRLQNDIKDIFKNYPEIAEEYAIYEDKQIPVISKLKDTLTGFVSSLLWIPKHSTASFVSKKNLTFPMGKFGEITVKCCWKTQSENNPAYISVSWTANIKILSELWAIFVNPETEEILYEAFLGTSLQGEKDFTSNKLGFDPSTQKWVMALILKDVK